MDRLASQQELFQLLGNCTIALALGQDPEVLELAKQAAEQHIRELDERFPDWKRDLKDLQSR